MKRYAKEILMLCAAVGMLLLAFNWLRSPRVPKLAPLKMTAGDASGLRHKMALELAKEAARFSIPIDVQPTAGSEAALEGLKNGDFDLAFVQGGLSGEGLPGIRQVTALHIEPLHLVVKPSLYERIEASGLGAINGSSVNVGPVGSGTQILASEILKFAGLSPLEAEAAPGGDHYRAVSLTYRELLERPLNDLPEAIFAVSSLPSPLVDFLIESREYRLVPLPFGEAMSLAAFLQLGDQVEPGVIEKHNLFETRIPAFTYSVKRSEPPLPLATIGTRLLLAANERVPDDVVQRLLDVLYGANFALAERPPLNAALLDLPSEFPMHPGSMQYRTRNKPLIAGDAIDYWEKVLAIAATLAGGTFFLMQWYLRWSRRKREANFASYMERVITIENAAMQTELSATMDLGQLIRLQRELSDLKSEAVRKFAGGDLEGEGLIHGFLALVNDARNQLTRLILHQRDNIEEQAAQQSVDAEKIWSSQTKIDPSDTRSNT